MPNLSKIYLFRMTHIENIPHILQYGITHSKSKHSNKNYLPIGDESLILSRTSLVLPNGKALGDYIPFYFGYRMPMLYVIQKGFNSVKATPVENIVYCISTVARIIDLNLEFVFTNGHAIDKFSSIYSQKDIEGIENIIDRKAIESKYWKDENDLDLKRRKEAEFLIADDIPTLAIAGYCVYNENAKGILVKFGIEEKQIAVRPHYYF